ncbi:RING-H2 finger protein ATL13 [Vigna radiata var. radiata]|uniref:RING-type E3 ubiquitin transferase n=1 Tax=Vigna radiata var. radiata TaxID=3916 RepID=A0A1S3UHQ9_VIGRR|nr:RING-H2 finger protein ATL13 [Vigna radiata var. radiata]
MGGGDAFVSQPEQPPYFLSQPNSPFPPTARSDSFSLNDRALKVSPSILLIIIILAIVFFISGLLHLLVRFLWRPQTREPDDLDNATALQGQLQQLFHLHDAGVDQSFIDTLPVFLYKAIIGLKNPFDCAVCLCEFEPEDKLRLLPKCSHAFHMECIDTWLLSHSTCPLCRASLLPEFSVGNSCSPYVLVLESGSESSREIVPEREAAVGRSSSVMTSNSRLGCHGDSEFGSTRVDLKSGELLSEAPDPTLPNGVEKVVTVKLGKFKSVDGGGDGGEGSSTTNNVDSRRCFSMGSFAYVMDESSSLQVPIRTPIKKQSSKKKSGLPLTPGHRPAMSECDCESRRDFKFAVFDATIVEDDAASSGAATDRTTCNENSAAIGRNRKESFSISKIWLRGKKDKPNAVADSSRRAVSFRFPAKSSAVAASVSADDDLKGKNSKFDTRSTISEMDIGKWENGGGSEFDFDEENQSCYSMDSSQARAPSFARRTLLWLTGGRQNKVVHSASNL